MKEMTFETTSPDEVKESTLTVREMFPGKNTVIDIGVPVFLSIF